VVTYGEAGAGLMIAPIWRGWAPQATAGDYQRHYQTEVTGHLQRVDGFRGARLLRQDDGHEVMSRSLIWPNSATQTSRAGASRQPAN